MSFRHESSVISLFQQLGIEYISKNVYADSVPHSVDNSSHSPGSCSCNSEKKKCNDRSCVNYHSCIQCPLYCGNSHNCHNQVNSLSYIYT